MYRARGYISLLLIVVLISQMLCGCANQDNTGGSTNGIIQEKVISEQFIREAKISEERLNEKYILEHLVYEKGIYEYRIDEDIISEA